jgi:tRNA(1-methyladenosine) methyltransferase and related methyltransferases
MYVPKNYKKLKRGPQVILPKDIGFIMAYAGVAKTASAWMQAQGAAGSPYRWQGYASASSAMTSGRFPEDSGKEQGDENLDNLELKNQDFTKPVKERDADLVTLDMPNAEKALRNAYRVLKPYGYVVGYLPHMEQVKKFVKKLSSTGFYNAMVYEIIARDMLVREEGMRPSTKGVWHTAYLVFAEKEQKQ